MSDTRRKRTSIVSTQGALTSIVARELVPLALVHSSAAQLSTPDDVSRVLDQLQHNFRAATVCARSLPFLGGAYYPDVTLAVNTPTSFNTMCQGAAAWLIASPRPTASQSTAVTILSVVEVSQSAQAGTVTIASSAALTCDLFFYPKPQASLRVVTPGRSPIAPGTAGSASSVYLWGSVTPFVTVTAGASFTAAQDTSYRIDSTGGAVTATLQTGASDGHRVLFKLVGASVAAAFTIIAGAGDTVELTGSAPGTFGASTTYWSPGGILMFEYHAATRTWNEVI